jgi:ketosteroid isomerase-like protein
MQAPKETTVPTTANAAVETVYEKWDEALGAKDLDAAMALYAPDATLESPLVRHHLGQDTGVVNGREALRDFVRIVFERQPPQRRRHRTGFLTDGRTLMWEYPRSAPDGEQMDFAEVMEIEDGLIRHHRVYWGWYGLRLLERDAA